MTDPASGHGENASAASDHEMTARQRVEVYLKPVYEDPINDNRKLSARAVCAALRMSFNTLKKYGLQERIEAAKEFREREREKAGMETGSSASRAIKKLRAERDRWKKKYENLLDEYTNLQYALRLEPGVDIERVLRRTMPKAIREAPGKGKRRGPGRYARRLGAQ